MPVFDAELYAASCALQYATTLSGSSVQVGWTPGHSGITGNGLADAAIRLAAEVNPSDDFPRPPSCLRSQTRSRLLQER